MATSYKTLAQSSPTAATYTELYQVPASTEAVISTINIANISNTSGLYRLAVTQSATAASAVTFAEHIAYDVSIEGNDATALTLGITLNNQRKLVCRANTASVSFNVFGSEIT